MKPSLMRVTKIFLFAECNAIAQCKRRNCTNASNVVCQECLENNVFFKTWNATKECQRKICHHTYICFQRFYTYFKIFAIQKRLCELPCMC